MSIVLKTDPRFMRLAAKYHDGEVVGEAAHDAMAANAMQMAIAEFSKMAATCRPLHAAQWINERAAANLARLMGEGNG